MTEVGHVAKNGQEASGCRTGAVVNTRLKGTVLCIVFRSLTRPWLDLLNVEATQAYA